MFESVCQYAIFFCGIIAFYLASHGKRVGNLIGLVSQPFWFWTTYKHGQMGIFWLSICFAGVYAYGVWETYVRKPTAKERLKLIPGDCLRFVFDSPLKRIGHISVFRTIHDIVARIDIPIRDANDATMIMRLIADSAGLWFEMYAEDDTQINFRVMRKAPKGNLKLAAAA